MNDIKELERHAEIIEKIKNATVRDELPNIGINNITSYLANNVFFNNQKIRQSFFKPVVNMLLRTGNMSNSYVKNVFIRVINDNYGDISISDINDCYNKLLGSIELNNLVSEIIYKNSKLEKIVNMENNNLHKEIMKRIELSATFNDLPKITIDVLERRLLKLINKNDYYNKFTIKEIKELTLTLLNKNNKDELIKVVTSLCNNVDCDNKSKLVSFIIEEIEIDHTISYIIDEILAIEERKLKIYEENHEDIMKYINTAVNISQLPQDLTQSILTHYLALNINSLIKDNSIKPSIYKSLTELLLDGYLFDDKVIYSEVKKMLIDKCFSKGLDFDLIYKKISMLPRTYYLRDEINASIAKQKELIDNNCSNVNIYYLPNEKTYLDGGRFYNCYINKVNDLDLNNLLITNVIDDNMLSLYFVKTDNNHDSEEAIEVVSCVKVDEDDLKDREIFDKEKKINDLNRTIEINTKEIELINESLKKKQEELDKINEVIKSKNIEKDRIDSSIDNLIRNYKEESFNLLKKLLVDIKGFEKTGVKEGDEVE